MSEMLQWALRYAALGFHVFPLHSIRDDGRCGCASQINDWLGCRSPGKHPRIKWKEGASCDPEVVRAWWTKWPRAGIGLATGPSKILAFDLDGPKGLAAFGGLLARRLCPPTARSKTARGWHVLFRGEGGTRSNPETKLDTRGAGGFIVLAPSPHVSGHVYRWEVEPFGEGAIAEAPAALVAYSQGGKRGGPVGGSSEPGIAAAPLVSVEASDFTMRLGACLVDWHEVDRALASINPDCSMDQWIKVGMALHAAGDSGERWDQWSSRGSKYREGEPAYKWTTFKQVPGGVGLGSLFVIAQGFGYKREEVMPPAVRSKKINGYSTPETRPPLSDEAGAAHLNGHANGVEFFQQFNESADNPLIRLNKDYAVIGNVGGKCLVLSWENSQVDQLVKVPTFQSFKSFSERFGNQYVTVKKVKHLKGGDEEYEDAVQLGAHWLKWGERRTYEGIELAPNQEEVLPNGNYNLWRGFGVEPKRGDWSLMRRHIDDVLAKRDSEALEYITNFAAWSVQHPGERAEAALVTRGDKGVGKGVFFGALRQIFGGHGLQIFNRSHLVGNFNAHRRNCLFMFADEAFWAGDKQGESVLKGLITEPLFMLEQKGVDAVQWPNRIKLGMAANADWVVPASHDERRYAVFDVAKEHRGDRNYFRDLFAEISNGGIAAMLYDLLRMELGGWHPRIVPQTRALQEQKAQSLPPLMEWWEGWMQEGIESETEWTSSDLMRSIREDSPGAKNYSSQRIAKFLYEVGATRRRIGVSKWQLPTISKARAAFERRYGEWKWE